MGFQLAWLVRTSRFFVLHDLLTGEPPDFTKEIMKHREGENCLYYCHPTFYLARLHGRLFSTTQPSNSEPYHWANRFEESDKSYRSFGCMPKRAACTPTHLQHPSFSLFHVFSTREGRAILPSLSIRRRCTPGRLEGSGRRRTTLTNLHRAPSSRLPHHHYTCNYDTDLIFTATRTSYH
jgi:hypothetical protein